MGFIKFTTAFIFLALFSIALITFAINFATDNSASIDLSSDTDLVNANTGIKSEVESFHVNTETASDAYAESTLSLESGETEGGTQFKVTPWNSLGMGRRAISTAYDKIFGEDGEFAIILTTLVGILGFIMIAYAYKAWKGNPD